MHHTAHIQAAWAPKAGAAAATSQAANNHASKAPAITDATSVAATTRISNSRPQRQRRQDCSRRVARL